MTSEILYTGRIKREELATFIETCGFRSGPTSGTYFLAENLPTQVIAPEDRQDLLVFSFFNLDIAFANYSSGRIFSEQGELRWEGQYGELRVIYLGDPSFASVKNAVDFVYKAKFSEKNAKLIGLDRRERFYYLFGTKLDLYTIEQINGEHTKNPVQIGDFAELRIHRILRYPAPGHVPDKGYVQLQVLEYVDPGSGQVQYFRFQGLDEERHNGEESRR